MMSLFSSLFRYGFKQSQSPSSSRGSDLPGVATEESGFRSDSLLPPTPPMSVLRGARLGLVRISQVDINLHSLCEFIYNPLVFETPPSDFILMEAGAILGRQSKVPLDDPKSHHKKIINIGIPAEANLISREQVLVVDIIRAGTDNDTTLQLPNTSDGHKAQFISFLHSAQTNLPRLTIRVNDRVRNYIRVHKKRADVNLGSILQSWETLDKGHQSLLTVGDVIVFDASYKNTEHKYMYRLVAVIDSPTLDKAIVIDCPQNYTPNKLQSSKSTPDSRKVSSTQKRTPTDKSIVTDCPQNYTPNKLQTSKSTPDSRKVSSTQKRTPTDKSIVTDCPQNYTPNKLQTSKSTPDSRKVSSTQKRTPTIDLTQSSDGTPSFYRDNKRKISEISNLELPSPRKQVITDDHINQLLETTTGPMLQAGENDPKDPNPSDIDEGFNDAQNKVLISDIHRPMTLENYSMQSIPKIGDRFRVLFSIKDIYGRHCDVWNYASALSVAKKRMGVHSLNLQFDDKTIETLEYPGAGDDKIERVVEKIGDDQSSKAFVIDEDGNLCPLSYDSDPKELFVGDLVLCRHQNGDQWYHGRVAATSVIKKTVDVAYFDGDYEEKIPLATGNIYLIERGRDNLKWLIGVTLPSSFVSLSSNVSSTTVVIQGSQLGLMHVNGQMQKFQYDDLVRVIFLYYRLDACKKNAVKRWPCLLEKQGSTGLHKTSKLTARFEEHKWIRGESDIDVDDDNDDCSIGSDISLQSNGGKEEAASFAEIRPTIFANLLWRSMNSSQPHHGFGFLCYFSRILKQGPTDSLTKNLQTFMLEGPKSDGVNIKDPNKTDLVYHYMNHMNEQYMKHGVEPKIHPSSWDDFHTILSLPSTYSQQISNEPSAPRRLYPDLQFSCRTLELISKLIVHELKEAAVEKKLSTCKKLYRSKVIVSYAIRNGIRESLKSLLHCYIKIWIDYEIFRLNPLYTSHWNSSDFDGCLNEYEGCAKSIGIIVSCLAFVYCAENGLDFGCNDCCYLFRDIVQSEIRTSSSKFPPDDDISCLNKKNDFIFRVILSLETSFSFPFQAKVAELFALSRHFLLVFDGFKL